MTHLVSLDDWDSDEDDADPGDCSECSAVLNDNGLCWFCDRARGWIWEEA